MVHYGEGRSEVTVFVFQRVEAMRACGHDLLDTVLFKHSDVGARPILEQEFVTNPPRGVPSARLFLPQTREAHSGALQQLGHRTGRSHRTRIGGARASN